jgi:diguanylate cyclase (GGDEF)-like protein/PAS domain S-box-containing protein
MVTTGHAEALRTVDSDRVRALTLPRRAGARVLVHLLATGAAALLFAVATLTAALPDGLRRPLADGLLAVVALAVGVVVLRTSRRGDPANRPAWRWASYAVLAWGGGQTWYAVEHALTGSVTRPGPCDVGFLLGVALAIRAALAFPTVSGNGAGRGRALLDGAVVAGCALLLTWVLVLADPAAGGGVEGWGVLLAYPLLDCGIATVLVVAAVRLPREHAVPLSLALAGVLVLLVTNLVTFSLGRSGALRSPEPAEVGFLLGFGLLGLGGLLQSTGRAPAAQVTSLVQQLLPYAGVPPVVLVLLLHPERLTAGPVALTVVLAALLLVRQVLAVAENDQLNARLLDRARRYQALVQGSADLTLVLDAEGRVGDASPSALRLLGDVRGRHWADLVVDPETARDDLARCAGLTDGVTTAALLRTPDGEVHLDARLTDLSHRREVGGVVVNARDVTDRWRTQRALEDSERRYRQMVETAAEGLAVSDADGVLRFGNRRLAELLGQPLDALVGRREDEVVAPLLDDEGRRLLAQHIARRRDGESSTYALTLTRADGPRHLRIAATPLHDADGAPDGSMALVTDVTEQVELERRLQQEALTDHLTGLGNRRALVEGVPSRFAGRALALLYVDLDDFKAVNDSAGHAAGDELLRQVAGRLRTCVRDDDLVVRLGGDEFAAVLVDEVDEVSAVQAAERVLQALAQPVRLDDGELVPSASIGVALSPAGQPDRVAALLRSADAALYAAKASGRGRVCTASEAVVVAGLPAARRPIRSVQLPA